MRKFIFILFLSFLGISLLFSLGFADTHTVASPYAPADVAAAITAAVEGDTVQFPTSSSATWSTTVTVNKAITIDGNGSTDY